MRLNQLIILLSVVFSASLEAKITDSLGTRTVTYTFDTQSRLNKETKANGYVAEYAYDSNGNRTQVKTTVGATIDTATYTFDSLNRLISATDTSAALSTGNSKTTSYAYDSNGNQTSVTYDNGDVTTKTYDSLNRITKAETKGGDGAVKTSFVYTLANTGHRTKVVELDGTETSYTYDNLYRLTGVSVTNHPVFSDRTTSFVYDKVGNKTQQTVDGASTNYSYDNNDRLTNKGSIVYTYDANGNTLTKAINSVQTDYQYNDKDKMVQAVETDNGTTTDTVTYQYDIDGIRTAKNDDGIITNYFVDKNRAYAQVLKEVDSANQIITSYLYGDDLIKMSKASNDSYYLYDAHGSVRALSDNAGSVTDTFDYSAYGIVIDSTGTTDNSYLYAGEQFDENLEQYYLRARYYDAGRGFTQMDSWMGSAFQPVTLNKYIYAGSDPVMNTDPTGKSILFGQMAQLSIRGISIAARVLPRGGRLVNIERWVANIKNFGSIVVQSGSGSQGVTGALKHIANEILVRKGATNTLLAEIVALQELRAVINLAVSTGLRSGQKVFIQHGKYKWELIFELEANGVWKLFHVVVRSVK